MNHYLSSSQPTVRSLAASRFVRVRRFLMWLFLVLFLSGLATVGWLGYQARAALSRISEAPTERQNSGGLLPFLHPAEIPKLHGEESNRINILLLGMGGLGHPGGTLTDTMMVLSFQPNGGRLALLSLPRDLYVPIPGHGSAKLNSAHADGEQDKSGGGPALVETTVSNLLGIPINYYLRVDFAGFTKLVNAVGGVDVIVEKTINDPFFPDAKLEGYEPFYLKAGPTHMDGTLALKFARSRETTSDFDRSGRQQLILKALKEKVLSLGTLANPKKVLDLIGIAGDHVRTDLAVWEIERLVELGKDIQPDKITTRVLDTAADGPLTSRTDEQAGYIIVARRGNFSELQKIAKNMLTSQPTTQATIAIRNASGQAALGGNLALLLRGYGYQVSEVTMEPKVVAKSRLITADQNTYPEITNFFKQRFGVTPEPPTSQQTSDFVMIVGQDYAKKNP